MSYFVWRNSVSRSRNRAFTSSCVSRADFAASRAISAVPRDTFVVVRNFSAAVRNFSLAARVASLRLRCCSSIERRCSLLSRPTSLRFGLLAVLLCSFPELFIGDSHWRYLFNLRLGFVDKYSHFIDDV